jgi:HEAT repeat protein
MSDDTVPIDDSPADRIAAAITKYGEPTVARRAASLLAGANEGEEFLLWVGGRHAQGVLDGAPPLYWPEVWGARALLYAWDDPAASVVVTGLHDRAWRVREMCARVCLARGIGSVDDLVPLLLDSQPRVRAAAARVLATHEEARERLTPLLRDPEKDVRRAVREALDASS